jgi:hypothetical protein
VLVFAARRWLHAAVGPTGIACVLAGVVLLAGLLAIKAQPDTYTSGASIVFLDPPSLPELEEELGEELSQASESPLVRDKPRIVGDMFVRIYRGSAKRRQLAQAGFAGRLSVSTVLRSYGFDKEYGPVFTIVVDAPTPLKALEGAQLVASDVVTELAARQSAYDPRLSVRAVEATPPSTPRLASGSHLRATVAFGLLALILLVTTPWTVRNLSRRFSTSWWPGADLTSARPCAPTARADTVEARLEPTR